MQFVETEKLKSGMRLAKPIYSKTGVMLYDRDTRLTNKGINSIKNFNLIGIFILEPAEPVPPMSEEDQEFEQFQTVSVFQIREVMEALRKYEEPKNLTRLTQTILRKYGTKDHKINFTQSIRSRSDFAYKHAINVAILTAIMSGVLRLSYNDQFRYITTALLYDIGYLFMEQGSMMTSHKYDGEEKILLQAARRKGFDILKSEPNYSTLPEGTVELVSQLVTGSDPAMQGKLSNVKWHPGTKLIRVADAYDRMTAMNLEEEPISDVLAVRHLKMHPETYDRTSVNALVAAIHLLPAGCSVDLTNGNKALVIEENPMDFMHPVILQFSDNKLYDLSDPEVAQRIQITDVMKTMDNRIHVDEDTLKQFKGDSVTSKTLEKFRQKHAIIEARKRQDMA